MPSLTTTTIEAPQTIRSMETVRPAGFSPWRWLVAAIGRRIELCKAARLAKVERALRSGIARLD